MQTAGGPSPVIAATGSRRDVRIDFLRGIALLFIFVDHVPDSLLSLFTLKSYAFADAAELFFFLSGLVAAMVYGRMAGAKGVPAAAWKVWRRAGVLYLAQILLLVLLLAEVWLAVAVTGHGAYHDQLRLGAILTQPDRVILHALLLRYQPTYLDILPVYVLLLGAFPVALAGFARHRWLVLSLSAALYGAVQIWAITPHSFPHGDGWFFNPLAWQFLFLLGASLGYPGRARSTKLFDNPWLLRSALAVVAIVALLQLPEALRMIWPHLPALRPADLAIDKAALEPLRLVSFFALALLARRIVPTGERLARWRGVGAIARCGRHSLQIFCAGVLLAVAGKILAAETGHGLLIQTLFSLVGIGALLALAASLDGLRKGGWRLSALRPRRNQPA